MFDCFAVFPKWIFPNQESAERVGAPEASIPVGESERTGCDNDTKCLDRQEMPPWSKLQHAPWDPLPSNCDPFRLRPLFDWSEDQKYQYGRPWSFGGPLVWIVWMLLAAISVNRKLLTMMNCRHH